jgi:UDP-N-acetylmuramoyl-tripeptide--D-alanyl-D-alanine ligase
MARAASGTVAVHTVEDVAGAVRVATELIAPGDVVFVKASSEYGLGACARELSTY